MSNFLIPLFAPKIWVCLTILPDFIGQANFEKPCKRIQIRRSWTSQDSKFYFKAKFSTCNVSAESVMEFLWFAVAWCASHGIKVGQVLTYNEACYKSWKFRDACREFEIKHKRIRPYRPQTNGKAERFIRTALKEWAYA